MSMLAFSLKVMLWDLTLGMALEQNEAAGAGSNAKHCSRIQQGSKRASLIMTVRSRPSTQSGLSLILAHSVDFDHSLLVNSERLNASCVAVRPHNAAKHRQRCMLRNTDKMHQHSAKPLLILGFSH